MMIPNGSQSDIAFVQQDVALARLAVILAQVDVALAPGTLMGRLNYL